MKATTGHKWIDTILLVWIHAEKYSVYTIAGTKGILLRFIVTN